MKNLFKKTSTYFWGAGILAFMALVILLVTYLMTENTVAKVGSEKITKEELYDHLVDQYGKTALDTMITNNMIEQEAEKQKIKVTDKEIQKELDKVAASYGGEDAFEEQLTSSGSTKKQLKAEIKQYLQTVKLLEPGIKITDEEISDYFDKNKDSLAQKEQVEASHILVEDKETADKVLKKVKAGEDFADLAKEYSTDSSTAEKGGALGYFSKGDMTEEFENAAFKMNKGEISDPVKTDYGYHIIKLTGKKAAKEATLKDSKAEITEALKNEKIQSEYSTWIQKKEKEYDIYNSLES